MAEYIDREELLRALNKNSITKKITVVDSTSVYDTVKNIPAADVAEVKHGKWILSETNTYGAPNTKNRTRKICSCCGWQNAYRYSYCPYCGVKMDGKEKE